MSESSRPISLSALHNGSKPEPSAAPQQNFVRREKSRTKREPSSRGADSSSKKTRISRNPECEDHSEEVGDISRKGAKKPKRPFESHKQPGKARVVEFPSGVLDQETYDALLEHAKSSLLYYGSHYNYTEGQLREKLVRKGYPEGTCRVDWDGTGEVVEENIIDLAVEKCYQMNLVPDEKAVAVRIARTMSDSGRSPKLIMNKLVSRRFNDEALQAARDYLDSSGASKDSVKVAVQRCYRSLMTSGVDAATARDKTIRRMFSRGFDYADVVDAVDDVGH